jgi:hypothetical protein
VIWGCWRRVRRRCVRNRGAGQWSDQRSYLRDVRAIGDFDKIPASITIHATLNCARDDERSCLAMVGRWQHASLPREDYVIRSVPHHHQHACRTRPPPPTHSIWISVFGRYDMLFTLTRHTHTPALISSLNARFQYSVLRQQRRERVGPSNAFLNYWDEKIHE